MKHWRLIYSLYSRNSATVETLFCAVSHWWNFDCWYWSLDYRRTSAYETLTDNAWVFILGSQPLMNLWLLILESLLHEDSYWWNWLITLGSLFWKFSHRWHFDCWYWRPRRQPLMKLWVITLGSLFWDSATDETLTANTRAFTLRNQPLMELWLIILGSLFWGVSHRWNSDCWRLSLYSGESATDGTQTADTGVLSLGSHPPMKLWLISNGPLFRGVSYWWNLDCWYWSRYTVKVSRW